MDSLKTFAMVLNRSKLPKDIRRLIIGKCVVKKIACTYDCKEEWFVKFGEINGVYKKWHKNNNLSSRSLSLCCKYMYKDGKLNGIYKRWYINCQLWLDHMFKDGKQNGLCKTWHKNGKLEYEGMYKDGKRNSLCKRWHKNGQLDYEGMFKDGVEI